MRGDQGAAIERYAKGWADGQEGPFEFRQRLDGLYLTEQRKVDGD